MPKPTILVIEDDAAIRRGIVDALALHAYETREAADGRGGLELALTSEWDLLLLDLLLPEIDGLEILRELRVARPTAPVIILTARGEEDDRVRGLRLGADDYVVKPFGVRELLARVEAVLRRSPERPSDLPALEWPGVRVDLPRRSLHFDDGHEVELSEREAALLRYLAVNRGRAVSRDEILSRVWHLAPSRVETRTVDMHIARLRQKLRDDGAEPRIIRTLRGRGYEFDPGGA